MMRIARLETYTTEFVCFVRLTTDDGHVGWGQTSTYNADITASIFHRQVAPWALGANALDIDALVDRIEEREHKYPGSYRCRAIAGWIPHCGTCAASSRISRWSRSWAVRRSACEPMHRP